MSSGFALLYFKKNYEFCSYCYFQGFLSRSGLSLENPGTGVITALSPIDGTQEIVQPSYIYKAIMNRIEINFQWWFTEFDDLYCRFRFLNNYSCVELGLDGLSEEECHVVFDSCITLSRLLIDLQANIGLIFDRAGNSEDIDWDRVFIYDDALPPFKLQPNLIIFKKSSRVFHELFQCFSSASEYRDFCILSKSC